MNMEAYLEDRNNLDTPAKLDAVGLYLSNMGASLVDIEPFTQELEAIVETMKEQLANEKRILEGDAAPEYTPLENELSQGETKDDQWTNDLLNGCSTIARTRTLVAGLSSLPCSARPNSPASPMLGSGVKLVNLPADSCLGTSGGCGCGTDATNESSECTVPMTSELTPGTPSEAK
jgi:hypothetical protein